MVNNFNNLGHVWKCDVVSCLEGEKKNPYLSWGFGITRISSCMVKIDEIYEGGYI